MDTKTTRIRKAVRTGAEAMASVTTQIESQATNNSMQTETTQNKATLRGLMLSGHTSLLTHISGTLSVSHPLAIGGEVPINLVPVGHLPVVREVPVILGCYRMLL